MIRATSKKGGFDIGASMAFALADGQPAQSLRDLFRLYTVGECTLVVIGLHLCHVGFRWGLVCLTSSHLHICLKTCLLSGYSPPLTTQGGRDSCTIAQLSSLTRF